MSSAPHIVGAILVFRLYYYVIPLFLAGSLFAGNEILLRGGGLLQHFGRMAPVQAVGRWSEPDFAVTAATGAVGLCGVLMLCLGVLAPQTDFSWIDPDYGAIAARPGIRTVPDRGRPRDDGGRTVASRQSRLEPDDPVAGDGSGVRGDPDNRLWVSGILVLTTMLLAPFRACFYRHAHLMSGPLQPGSALTLAVLGLCLYSLAVTRSQTHGLHNNAFWAVILSRELPN